MEKHYSYRVYADPETARSFDSQRFGGAIGGFVREAQERLVFKTLPDVRHWRVIDIGAGTGRFTVPFLEMGSSVVACDASPEMLKVLKEKTDDSRLQAFVSDAHHLHFADRSFDCAVSFRILLHVVDWKRVLSEICRVSKDWVVFDFPPRHGFLLLVPLWHRLQQLVSTEVQPYRTIAIHEVVKELNSHGFRIVSQDPGFFLPLVIHRTIGSVRFTQKSEKTFTKLGLARVAGSPMTIFARRIQ